MIVGWIGSPSGFEFAVPNIVSTSKSSSSVEALPFRGSIKELFAVGVAEFKIWSLDDAACKAEVGLAAVLDGDALFPVSAL